MKHKNIVYIICLLALIALISLIFGLFIKGKNLEEIETMIELPEMNFEAYSNKDEKNHSITIDFTVGYKGKDITKDEIQQIYEIVNNSLKTMEFDKISEDKGLDYIKKIIEDDLEKEYLEKIEKVYVTNMIFDAKIPSKNKNKENARDKMIKGLFPNVK